LLFSREAADQSFRSTAARLLGHECRRPGKRQRLNGGDLPGCIGNGRGANRRFNDFDRSGFCGRLLCGSLYGWFCGSFLDHRLYIGGHESNMIAFSGIFINGLAISCLYASCCSGCRLTRKAAIASVNAHLSTPDQTRKNALEQGPRGAFDGEPSPNPNSIWQAHPLQADRLNMVLKAQLARSQLHVEKNNGALPPRPAYHVASTHSSAHR